MHAIISLFRCWISDILVCEVDQSWVISGHEINVVRKLSRNVAAVKYFVDRTMTTQIACFDKKNVDIFLLWT